MSKFVQVFMAISDDFNLERLREAVCGNFGRKVLGYGDAVKLKDKISEKPSLGITTIRRFFGLVKDGTTPSIATLDVLCRYIGYPNWSAFIDDPSGLCLTTAIQRTSIVNKGLDFYWKEIPNYWGAFFDKSRSSAKEIYNMPDNDWKQQFFKDLGATKNAHDTFWEWFPNLNVLRKNYYIEGLLSYRNSKNTNDAHCYANGMLFLGSYLAKREDEAENYYQFLASFTDTADMWPLPLARRTGALLIWLHHKGHLTDEVEAAVLAEYWQQQESEQNRYTNSYASILIEYLLVGGLPSLVGKLLHSGKYYPFAYQNNFARLVHYHEVRTIEALALAVVGDIEQSKKIFREIAPEKYSFNDDKYYSCFYAILAAVHGENHQKVNLKKLIFDTYYTRFYDLLALYTSKK